MKPIDNTEDIRFKFLLNEYAFLSDYLKANYEERDRYVNFYMIILAPVVGAIGFAIDKGNYYAIILLSFLTSLFSYFVFIKVLYQRSVVTEYKNYLNLTRGKLYELVNFNYEIKSILLPTTASNKYYKTKGGDAALHHILRFITAVSAATAVSIPVARIFALSAYSMALCFLVIMLIILLYLEHLWRIILQKKDSKTIEVNERRRSAQAILPDQHSPADYAGK